MNVARLLTALLFVVSLAVTLAAARLFARRLDRIGVRFGLPEALIGLLTALAADGPEVTSALVALTKGAHNVSVGVLVGSNVFNLAAMIGLSALLAGRVRLPRDALLLEGAVGAAITLIAAALLLQWLAPVLAAVLAACILVPYLILLLGGSDWMTALPLLGGVVDRVETTLGQRGQPKGASASSPNPTSHLVGLIILDVALIVAGSAGMVQASISLSDHWHISSSLLGTLILAPLTSIPNALTGVRLGLADRGSALVGETFNSNTINLAVGVIVTGLFVSLVGLAATARSAIGWLIAMTALTLLLLGRRGGMGRSGGAALLLAYAGFVVFQVASG
jgi:cation:H+ antiporter